MGIPNATVIQMQLEGIASVDDLADFDKDSLHQLADNLRRPGGHIPDPNPGAAPGAMIRTPPFVFGAKSQKRLLVACNLIRYYNAVGRPLTAANMQWNTVMKHFEIQWKALVDRKDEDEPEVPKITKALPVIKWTEAFEDYMSRVIGVRNIPLAYVIRAEVVPPAALPTLAAGQPHSTEHGSVENELVARASHTHALYRDDNSAVYHKLEEATRTTSYAASIKPFQRGKDGRGAWMALRTQYAGRDKWEAEIKKQETLLHTRVWKGQSNFSLEGFISQHRNAYVSMQACAVYVQYQLPNEHSRVGFLLDAMQCSDAGLHAAMASIRTDDGPTGKRNNFEDAASYLLPYDPVANKRAATNKRGAAYISGVDQEDDGDTTGQSQKPGIGKTGVHFRYYKKDEYLKLPLEQKRELKEWREKNPEKDNAAKQSKKAQGKKTLKKLKKTISQMVATALKKDEPTTDSEKKQSADDKITAMVQSAVKKQLAAVSAASATVQPAGQQEQVSLNRILKAAKNTTKGVQFQE